MRLNVLIVFISLLLFSTKTKAQQNDFEAGLYNIGIGSIFGGVGALINKKPNEKRGKVFIKGIGKGALGGYLVFEIKRLIRTFDKTGDYTLVWPSKLVNAVGSSIIESAAANRSMWDRWHIPIGFSRIEFSTKENFNLSFRILPFALAGTVINSTRGKFDFERSLKTGIFIFTTDYIPNDKSDGGFTSGQIPIYGNSILILDTWEGESALAHEMIHVYQQANFSGINSFFNNPIQKLSDHKKIYRLYSRIFYMDFNALLMGSLYQLETWRTGYRDNFFEEEAFYFTPFERRNPNGPVLFN